MNLQYISDSTGQTTGVFIPIADWNELKKKFSGIEQQEIDVPDWQINEVRERLENFKENPQQEMDFDTAIKDIEKQL